MWRIVSGNKQPWLFKYAFPDGKISDAIHNVEVSHFPKSLTYIDMIYVVAPIYSTILYASNAFTIAFSISLKNYHYLRATKNISGVMAVPVVILIAIFGNTLLKLVDDYLIKSMEEGILTQKDVNYGESIATVIIFSYTVSLILVVLINSLVNYFVVGKLTTQMKYYSKQKLEHENFIPLPSFIGGEMQTSFEDNSIEIDVTNEYRT
mmetsp:Transcript_25562/g.28389  ORF Transcript_25562/g.28389 Transcript_25562/m.28389 type:complete len:207 (+) Transcript_25562:178-798(+)